MRLVGVGALPPAHYVGMHGEPAWTTGSAQTRIVNGGYEMINHNLSTMLCSVALLHWEAMEAHADSPDGIYGISTGDRWVIQP